MLKFQKFNQKVRVPLQLLLEKRVRQELVLFSNNPSQRHLRTYFKQTVVKFLLITFFHSVKLCLSARTKILPAFEGFKFAMSKASKQRRTLIRDTDLG